MEIEGGRFKNKEDMIGKRLKLKNVRMHDPNENMTITVPWVIEAKIAKEEVPDKQIFYSCKTIGGITFSFTHQGGSKTYILPNQDGYDLTVFDKN